MMQARPFADDADDRVTLRDIAALALAVGLCLLVLALWAAGAVVGIRYAAARGLGV